MVLRNLFVAVRLVTGKFEDSIAILQAKVQLTDLDLAGLAESISPSLMTEDGRKAMLEETGDLSSTTGPPGTGRAPTPSCTKGDVKAVCNQVGEGGSWNNTDLTAWYGCLAENCMDQTDLWDGVTCDEALQMLKCRDPADMSGHQSFVGTVGDACPRSCKPKCKKCKTTTAVTTAATTAATTTTTTSTTTTWSPAFFLAEGGKSCTAACQAKAKTCDAKRLSQAALSWQTCKSVIESLGKTPTTGGQYDDDRSGCTYYPDPAGGFFQLNKLSGDAECDVVNADNARQRVCACSGA